MLLNKFDLMIYWFIKIKYQVPVDIIERNYEVVIKDIQLLAINKNKIEKTTFV